MRYGDDDDDRYFLDGEEQEQELAGAEAVVAGDKRRAWVYRERLYLFADTIATLTRPKPPLFPPISPCFVPAFDFSSLGYRLHFFYIYSYFLRPPPKPSKW
jgi:hypothetical protein